MAARSWTHQLFASSQKNLTEEQRSSSRSSETVRPFCPGCLLPSPLFPVTSARPKQGTDLHIK